MAGSCSSARASATFCRVPFDSSAARVDARPLRLEGLERAIDRAVGVREAVQAGVDAQVLAHRQSIPQPGRLREKPDPAPQRRSGRARQLHAVDRDRSARRRDQPRQHPQRRRLAGAVRPEQRDDLAAPTSNVTSLTTVRVPNRRVRPVAAITGGSGRAASRLARVRTGWASGRLADGQWLADGRPTSVDSPSHPTCLPGPPASNS